MEEEQIEKGPAGNKSWLIIGIIILVLILAGAGYYLYQKNTEGTAGTADDEDAADSTESVLSEDLEWQEVGVAVSGAFADAEVVDLGDGRFRMYYSVEPEVAGNKLELYSATSTDGKTWTQEAGTRKTFATFPDVIKIADSQWRMYFQNAGVIKSAVSTDGLVWTDESGIRVDKNESGFNLENVGAGSTTKLSDGTYIMVYRGMINEAYQSADKLPNKNTQIYFYATSPDGLNFTKKGLALDSRNETLLGLADGGEWTTWDGGELRLHFWSYKGVYHIVYANSRFSKTPVFDFINSKDTNVVFPPNPPGDPTLAKINGEWFLYYGQHTKGIYYANLK